MWPTIDKKHQTLSLDCFTLPYTKAELHQVVFGFHYEDEFLKTIGARGSIKLKGFIYVDHSQNNDDLSNVLPQLIYWKKLLTTQNQGLIVCIWTAHSKFKTSGV